MVCGEFGLLTMVFDEGWLELCVCPSDVSTEAWREHREMGRQEYIHTVWVHVCMWNIHT